MMRRVAYERAQRHLGAHANLRTCDASAKSSRGTSANKKMRHEGAFFLLAGVARFELTNKGVKVLCLTAWRYPYADYGIIPQKQIIVNSKVKLFKRPCILDKAVFSRYNI